MAGSAEISEGVAAARLSGFRETPISSERPLRIAFVLAGLGAGGAEKIINMLAHHRLMRGDSVHILALSAPDGASYFPYDDRISLESFGSSRRGWRNILSTGRKVLRLQRRLRELDPDLVVSFLTKINVQTTFAAQALGIPVIVSERNNFRTQRMSPLWRLLSVLGGLCSTRVVMQTDAARAALPPFLRDKSDVIPNPVLAGEPEPPRAAGCRHVVAVGRFDKQKGFDLLLRAFALARARTSGLRLTIYGEGPERASLESQARALCISDAVSLPGVTAMPGAWRSGASIFVLSSRFEGFPNALAEALAAGIPSIAFDCNWGPREIIRHGDNGLLVPPGDVAALADAIVELAENEQLRREISEKATHDMRFSVAEILSRWDALFEAAAKRR